MLFAHQVECFRERYGCHTCDKRRDASVVQTQFPFIDFSLVPENDQVWTQVRELTAELVERAYEAMCFLAERKELEIVVATSSAFLCAVFVALLETDAPSLRSWFHMGEMRSVQIEFSKRF